jgi:CheY-like chemotaxis protein
MDESGLPTNVLVVDDSLVCRARLKAMCTRLFEGVTIMLAADGEEALGLFEQQLRAGRPYDLVLMDLNMVGDGDRPQLSGMLDERNGPQASARMRRAEIAHANEHGDHAASRAIIIVTTGSTRCAPGVDRPRRARAGGFRASGRRDARRARALTRACIPPRPLRAPFAWRRALSPFVARAARRTDRWDLAYYNGCGIDGFLSKPVLIASLTDAVEGTHRKHGATPGASEAPLFGQAVQIDMYIEPKLLEAAERDAMLGPMAALSSLAPQHELDGLSAQLDTTRLTPLNERRSPASVAGRGDGFAAAAADAPRSPRPPPRAESSEGAVEGAVARSPQAHKMAPRLPRRASRGAVAPPAAVARAPPARSALHFLLVNAEPLALMMQTALIQSISLEHSITRAADAVDALDTLCSRPAGALPIDVLLLGPVRSGRTRADARGRARTRADAERQAGA